MKRKSLFEHDSKAISKLSFFPYQFDSTNSKWLVAWVRRSANCNSDVQRSTKVVGLCRWRCFDCPVVAA